MEFYSMERFEIIGDLLDEMKELLLHEADMMLNPFEITAPTTEEINMMALAFS